MNTNIKDLTDNLIARYENGSLSSRDCSDFLDSVPRFTSKHTTTDTRQFLAFMGNPDEQMKIIHVAGTNGKGSVCCFLTEILMSSGYSVGTFVSPHLVDIRERFLINDELIEGKDFVESFIYILKKVTEYMDGKWFPTFFEYLFFMAMHYYSINPVDFLILETGLGGRLDATSTPQNPILCAITEIGLDHMKYLGNTISEIAGEKAGIIRKGVPVVFIHNRDESADVIRNAAIELGAPFREIHDKSIRNIMISNSDDVHKQIDFSYYSEYDNYIALRVNSPAVYQTQNASIACECAFTLRTLGFHVSDENIRKAVEGAFWEGRMEEIAQDFYVDGAHNADGIEAFLQTAEGFSCSKKLLLFGVVDDKDYHTMIDDILGSGQFCEIAVTGLRTGRSVSEEDLITAFDDEKKSLEAEDNTNCNISFYERADEAVNYLLGKRDEIANTQNIRATDKPLIFAAGSLYLVGQIKELMQTAKETR